LGGAQAGKKRSACHKKRTILKVCGAVEMREKKGVGTKVKERLHGSCRTLDSKKTGWRRNVRTPTRGTGEGRRK